MLFIGLNKTAEARTDAQTALRTNLRRYQIAMNSKSDQEKQGQECFIATAAYGTAMSEELDILRRFRDDALLNTPVGKAFVAVYYKFSPSIAKFISKRQVLRTAVRGCLVAPAVALVRLIRSR